MISIKRRSVGDIIANVVIYILLTLIAVIMVIPFIYVIAASFATEAEIQTRPIFFIPDSPTLDAYARIYERYGYKSIPFIVNFSMCNSNRYIYQPILYNDNGIRSFKNKSYR